jgi:hypothetical protein
VGQDRTAKRATPAVPLEHNLRDISDAIGLCLNARKVLPALILLYSAMDAVAALERRGNEGTRSAFVRWVERYMSLDELGCTGLDLYAARCGILHGFSGSSDLSKARKARVVVYAWGSYPVDAVRASERRANQASPSVAVHVGALRRIFFEGISAWWADIGKDRDRLARVNEAVATWFVVAR